MCRRGVCQFALQGHTRAGRRSPSPRVARTRLSQLRGKYLSLWPRRTRTMRMTTDGERWRLNLDVLCRSFRPAAPRPTVIKKPTLCDRPPVSCSFLLQLPPPSTLIRHRPQQSLLEMPSQQLTWHKSAQTGSRRGPARRWRYITRGAMQSGRRHRPRVQIFKGAQKQRCVAVWF